MPRKLSPMPQNPESTYREWDAEIERDFSPGGVGMELLDEMKSDARAGKFLPFEEGRQKR